jgi:hypothetical protein
VDIRQVPIDPHLSRKHARKMALHKERQIVTRRLHVTEASCSILLRYTRTIL